MSNTINNAGLKKYVDDTHLTNYSLSELKQMKKDELIKLVFAYLKNRQILRGKMVNLGLENGFLERKVGLLEQQISFLSVTKHNFKSIKKYKNKAKELQKERLDGDL